jgi:hypothetical protein
LLNIPGLDQELQLISGEPSPASPGVPFPCPYFSGFIEKTDADNLFVVLDGFPKDQQIAAHAPTTSQPSTPTWKRVSGRLVVTFFDGSSEAAKGYVNRFGDCGSFVYDWAQAPAELQKVRAMLADRYGFQFKLVYMNYYSESHVPIQCHADREDVNTLFPIATISLGAERPWTTYRRDLSQGWPKHMPCYGAAGGWKVIAETRSDQVAEHGSLLVMEPGFQETHIHAVLPIKTKCGPRISLTFRHPLDVKTSVVSKYKGKYDLYVGRGSEWGNPFSDKPDSKAKLIVKPEEVMPKFREWFQDRIRCEEGFARKVRRELHGKTLGCYCEGGKPCHAAIMASWADLLAEKSSQFKGNPEAAKEWLKNAPYTRRSRHEQETAVSAD